MLRSTVICDVIAFLQQVNVKSSEKLVKIVKIDEEDLHIFWTTWWTCDNIKSHKRSGLHPLSSKNNFRKTTRRRGSNCPCRFSAKDTGIFPWGFCYVFQKAFFIENLWMAASVNEPSIKEHHENSESIV